MSRPCSCFSIIAFAGLVVGLALEIRRWPALGLLIALAPVAACFLGLALWMVTDYFRFEI